MIRIYRQKIIIIMSTKPEKEVNKELQWFGTSLGLFSIRDKDRSCFRVFIELLKSTKLKRPISSDEIAYRTSLSRGTVIHHINKLMESGIVSYENKKYALRADSLGSLVAEIEKDIKRACDDLKDVAKDIDNRLRL